jgi:hypothetical protein
MSSRRRLAIATLGLGFLVTGVNVSAAGAQVGAPTMTGVSLTPSCNAPGVLGDSAWGGPPGTPETPWPSLLPLDQLLRLRFTLSAPARVTVMLFRRPTSPAWSACPGYATSSQGYPIGHGSADLALFTKDAFNAAPGSNDQVVGAFPTRAGSRPRLTRHKLTMGRHRVAVTSIFHTNCIGARDNHGVAGPECDVEEGTYVLMIAAQFAGYPAVPRVIMKTKFWVSTSGCLFNNPTVCHQ